MDSWEESSAFQTQGNTGNLTKPVLGCAGSSDAGLMAWAALGPTSYPPMRVSLKYLGRILFPPPGNKTSGHIEESWKVLTSAYVQQKVRERVIPRAKSNFLAQIIVLLWG